MGKFKIGDCVRCKDAHNSNGVLEVGKEYLVTGCWEDPPYDEVYLAGERGRSWTVERFELVPHTKDAGIQQAIDNERKGWKELHRQEFAEFLAAKGREPFLPEEFRQWFTARGNPQPHHHNVWGAMWNSVVKQGLVVRTGGMRNMQDKRSHARVTSEWRAA